MARLLWGAARHVLPRLAAGLAVQTSPHARDVTAEAARQKLSRADVAVTNQSDKEVQLPKLLEMDEKVRQHFRQRS